MERELIVKAEKPAYFGVDSAPANGSLPNVDYWPRNGSDHKDAFFALTQEAFDVVGDDWRQHDAGKLLADWEQATARHVK
jgi:hypothetical protein